MNNTNEYDGRTMFAVVRFTREGRHCWPKAPEHRAYLATSHRHLFSVEARVEVAHDERDIEYHDLLDFCREHFPGGDLSAQSCETMSRKLAQKITAQFPDRAVHVSVFEDGEVGACFEC